MKLLIDTNILLDVLQKREPHYKPSTIIWKLCETKKADGYVSTLSFANIVYVLRKEFSSEKIEDTLTKLSLIFTFSDLSFGDLRNAAALNWNDFEDAIQFSTAERLGVDYIITRNIVDYDESILPTYSPMEFISNVEFD